MLCSCTIGAVVLWTLGASAQPTVPPANPDNAAWDLYERAVQARAQGRRDEAIRNLQELETAHPQHPAAQRGHTLLQQLIEARDHLPAGSPLVRRTTPELPPVTVRLPNLTVSRAARTELAIGQTVLGATAGFELCYSFHHCGTRELVISLMAGAGSGLGLSLLLGRNGVESSDAALLNEGALWGAWHALALFGAFGRFKFNSNADFDRQEFYMSLFFGQILGTAAGHLAWKVFRPTAGNVELASAGGVWFGVLTFMSMLAFKVSVDNPWSFGVMLAATDVGVIAASLLSKFVPMTRSRVLFLHAGGLLGLLIGSGIAALSFRDGASVQSFMGFGVGGAALGLGTAYFLTRNWDARAIQVSIAPAPNGANGSLAFAF